MSRIRMSLEKRHAHVVQQCNFKPNIARRCSQPPYIGHIYVKWSHCARNLPYNYLQAQLLNQTVSTIALRQSLRRRASPQVPSYIRVVCRVLVTHRVYNSL